MEYQSQLLYILFLQSGFFDFNRVTNNQARSLIISADWNAYELAEGNDCAYGQTVTRGE